MNRLEFINSFNADNIESSLKSYFDQIMGLYNFFHEYDFKSIDNEENLAQFIIRFKNKEDSKEVYEMIPSTMFMYNKVFNISKSISKNNVHIEMVEV